MVILGQFVSERDYNSFPVSLTGVMIVEIYSALRDGNIGL
jgi:hypothetical protein